MRSNYEYIKFHTKRPGYSELSETMTLSYDEGLYVAKEKVATITKVYQLMEANYASKLALLERQGNGGIANTEWISASQGLNVIEYELALQANSPTVLSERRTFKYSDEIINDLVEE
eukprot:gene23291-28186_t